LRRLNGNDQPARRLRIITPFRNSANPMRVPK
jgi:hypothetical protein